MGERPARVLYANITDLIVKKEYFIIIFKKEKLRYSLTVRFGIVDRVGLFTPKNFTGRTIGDVGRFLTKKGFRVSKILK